MVCPSVAKVVLLPDCEGAAGKERECSGTCHSLPDSFRECFQSGFGLNWEMFAVPTRREEGAYSEESVTDEQRSRDGKQPKGRPNAL